LIVYEDLGFCKKGEVNISLKKVGPLWKGISVNASGGLEAAAIRLEPRGPNDL
jgi:hypothetical protein